CAVLVAHQGVDAPPVAAHVHGTLHRDPVVVVDHAHGPQVPAAAVVDPVGARVAPVLAPVTVGLAVGRPWPLHGDEPDVGGDAQADGHIPPGQARAPPGDQN